MTRHDDFTALLESYLDEYEGATPLPADVRDAVRARIPSTMQRPAWWPERRFPTMGNMMRIALAAAAVVAAAVIGYTAFLGGQNVGAPGRDDPTSTPAPTANPDAVSLDTHPGGPLASGDYFVTVGDHRVTFTVSAIGWQKNVVEGVIWTNDSEARVSFGSLDNVNLDPCRPELGELDPPPGPTADELAAALAAIPGVEATSSDVALSGYTGRLVTLDVPETFSNCIPDGGEALLAGDATAGPIEAGVHRFWIVEVDGDRIVIGGVHRRGALSRQVQQLEAIIDSVQITGP
jgi:hypothetical protein